MMPPEESLKELQKGLRSLQQQNYPEAIAQLESFCEHYPDVESPFFVQAQMSLVRAYRGLGEDEQAVALCQALLHYADPDVKKWTKSVLRLLNVEDRSSEDDHANDPAAHKTNRADTSNIKISMPKVADSLKFAMGITVIFHLILGLVIFWSLFSSLSSLSPLWISLYSLFATFLINGVFFGLSPWLIDQIQARFYQTQPITLSDIQRYSPEAGEFLLRSCREFKVKLPRLGLIADSRPIAFTYGFSPSQACFVVSQGLLQHLADDEIAAIYAHEFGHLMYQDFRIMTLVSGWGQFFYLLYLGCEKLGQRGKVSRMLAIILGLPCYGLFQLNNLLNAYLSRTREYYADYFSVTVTGNPNALIRALIKIPTLRTQQELQAQQAAHFLQGMRNFAVCGIRSAAIAEKQLTLTSAKITQSLCWDLLNPWASLYEFIASHPLTGKRLQVLAQYGDQLGLKPLVNISQVRQEIDNHRRFGFYIKFLLELMIFLIPIFGLLGGWLIDQNKFLTPWSNGINPLLLGLGLGILLQTFVLSRSYQQPLTETIESLFYDFSNTSFWSRTVVWEGQLQIVPYHNLWGKNLYFHDKTAIIAVSFTIWGKAWQQLFTTNSEKDLLSNKITVIGEFRRSLSPYLALKQIYTDINVIKSYPQFWQWITAIAVLILSFLIK